VNSKNGQYYYKVPVFFDGIEPDNIAVQLFAEPLDGEAPEIYNMTRTEKLSENKKGFLYEIQLPAKRSINDYTPRVVLLFDGEVKPIETNQILWKQ
ncbi:MAG: hypothetical protein JW787_18010, partial [Sedimentisphaerales bacterium]|nr:hypothetical protein [Sedimentisphaerales bacterium]